MSLLNPPLTLGKKKQHLHDKDAEIEKKFQDGMLTKMSKITDLISKLDCFAESGDKDRVKKCGTYTLYEHKYLCAKFRHPISITKFWHLYNYICII